MGFACLIVVAWVYFFEGPLLMPDRALIENFESHRSSFEKVVAMMEEDSQLKVSPNDTFTILSSFPTPGFSTRRLNEYRALFADLGTPRATPVSRRSDEIEFSAVSAFSDIDYEFVVITKSYVYRKTPPSTLVDSLDYKDFQNSSWGCKHITGNWYLCFELTISKPE